MIGCFLDNTDWVPLTRSSRYRDSEQMFLRDGVIHYSPLVK